MNWVWAKAAGIRALKTFAQALAVFLLGGTVGLLDVPWLVALSASGSMALASLLTSVAGLPELPPQASKPLDQGR